MARCWGEAEKEPEVVDLRVTPDVEEVEAKSPRDLKEEAKSLDHMMHHKVFNPYCRACVEGRSQRKSHRKGALGAAAEKPTKFGEAVTGDHLICRRRDGTPVEDDNDPFSKYVGATAAMVLYDRGTNYLRVFPQANRSAEHTKASFIEFQGQDKILGFHSDRAPEIVAAAQALGWPMSSGTPGVPQTNGLAERYVRASKEGGRMNIAQSGLHTSWWEKACECFSFTRNTENGAYLARVGESSNHTRIPFGAMVDFMPTPNAEKPPPFESKTQAGLLVGYHTQPGGRWSGDYLVADFEPFKEDPDAEPRHVRVHRMKEVIPPGRLEPLRFPLAEFRQKQR